MRSDRINDREDKLFAKAMDRAKKDYDSTEIPPELGSMVARIIEEDKNKRKASEEGDISRMKDKEPAENPRVSDNKKHERKIIYMSRRIAAAAAAFAVLFTAGLNTSEAFADSMSSIPVLGDIAKVLTVRSYHSDEGGYNVSVEVPMVAAAESAGDDTEAFTEKVNAEIDKAVNEFTEQAEKEFEEYKEAFFATGGTEADWNDRQMKISVNYEVKYSKSPIVSFVLVTTKNWINSGEERYYYNLDLIGNKKLKLSDVLGEDYKSICNAAIDTRIKEEIANDENISYFGYGDNDLVEEKFTSVDEATDFYINEEGKVVVVFPKYAIAPGYMGVREFTVGNARI